MIHDEDLRTQLCEDLNTSFLVRAPAGSGKTHILMSRYLKAMLFAEHPQKVIALTFTQKAAQEMKDRLYQMLFSDSYVLEQSLKIQRDRVKMEAKNNPNHWIYHPQSWMIMTIDAYFYKLYVRFCDASQNGKTDLVLSPETHYTRLAETFITYLIESNSEVFAQVARFYHYKMSVLKKHFAYLLSVRERWFLYHRMRADHQSSWSEIFSQELSVFFQKISQSLVEDFLSFVLCYHPLYHNSPQNSFETCWFLARICLTEKGEVRKILRTTQGFVGEKQLSQWHTPALREHVWKCFLEIQECLNSQPLLKNFLNILRQIENRDCVPRLSDHFDHLFKLLVAWYEVEKNEKFQIDFIDLSESLLALFDSQKSNQDFDIYCQKNIQYFFIDEAQDLSWTQLHLMKLLLNTMEYSSDKSFFIVGDPQQAIYYFRGSDVSVFEDLSDFCVPGLAKKNLSLAQNFRSEPALVNFVNEWTAEAFGQESSFVFGVDRALESAAYHSQKEKENIFCTIYPNSQEEAYDIAQRVQSLLKTQAEWTIGILARDRASLKPIVKALEYFKITFSSSQLYMISDYEVFEDLCIGQKLLDDPKNRSLWLRFLRSRWIRANFQDIQHILQSDQETFWSALEHPELSSLCQKDLEPWIEYSLRLSAFQSRRAHLDRLWHLYHTLCMDRVFSSQEKEVAEDILKAFERFDGSWDKLQDWADQTALFLESGQSRVTVSTIHKAKGLEFDCVFLPNLGARLPIHDAPIAVFIKTQHAILACANPDPAVEDYRVLLEMQKIHHHYESYRLLYVALTRAKKHLYLSYHEENHHKRSFLSSLEGYFEAPKLYENSLVGVLSSPKKMHEKSQLRSLSAQADQVIAFNKEPWTWIDEDQRPQEKILGQVIHKILEEYSFVVQMKSKDLEQLWTTLWRKAGGDRSFGQDALLKWALWHKNLETCPIFQKIIQHPPTQSYQELSISFWNPSKKKLSTLRVDKVLELSSKKYWIIDWKIFFSYSDLSRVYSQLSEYQRVFENAWGAEIQTGIYVISSQKYYSIEDLHYKLFN